MPHNPHRGEIEARLDGRPHTLCLTLGALAELEAAFGHEDMLALAERFQSGRLSARDAVRIIGAGLRGAGLDIADGAVARMQADGGAAGFVDIVARLLSATFGVAAVSDPPGLTPLHNGPVSAAATCATDPDPSSRKPRQGPQAAVEAIRDPAQRSVGTMVSDPEGQTPPHPFPGPT
jgi:hypothetical protein